MDLFNRMFETGEVSILMGFISMVLSTIVWLSIHYFSGMRFDRGSAVGMVFFWSWGFVPFLGAAAFVAWCFILLVIYGGWTINWVVQKVVSSSFMKYLDGFNDFVNRKLHR